MTSNSDKIRRLKKELDDLKLSYQRRQDLTLKREELEEILQNLHQEITVAFTKRQTHGLSEQELHQLNSKERLLEEIKQRKAQAKPFIR